MELIVFIGLQGSGKSTFYKQKFVDTHLRLNLDMLRTRHREQVLLTACIEAKQPVVIDNTNPTLEVHTTPEHEELKALGQGCITKYHSHHYLGFAATQWKLFDKERPRRVKPLLYVYRVLLTGIHLMRTGRVEANLLVLNQEFRLPYINELVARKLAGPEQSRLPDADMAVHQAEYERLVRELEAAHEASTLPEVSSTREALDDLLVRLRMTSIYSPCRGNP